MASIVTVKEPYHYNRTQYHYKHNYITPSTHKKGNPQSYITAYNYQGNTANWPCRRRYLQQDTCYSEFYSVFLKSQTNSHVSCCL